MIWVLLPPPPSKDLLKASSRNLGSCTAVERLPYDLLILGSNAAWASFLFHFFLILNLFVMCRTHICPKTDPLWKCNTSDLSMKRSFGVSAWCTPSLRCTASSVNNLVNLGENVTCDVAHCSRGSHQCLGLVAAYSKRPFVLFLLSHCLTLLALLRRSAWRPTKWTTCRPGRQTLELRSLP